MHDEWVGVALDVYYSCHVDGTELGTEICTRCALGYVLDVQCNCTGDDTKFGPRERHCRCILAEH